MMNFREVFGDLNKTGSGSPLECWYEKIKLVQFDDFTVEDLCRSFRQNLCVNELFCIAMDILEENPLSGEYYDGELIASIAVMKFDELDLDAKLLNRAFIFFDGLSGDCYDNDVLEDVIAIKNKIRCAV